MAIYYIIICSCAIGYLILAKHILIYELDGVLYTVNTV